MEPAVNGEGIPGSLLVAGPVTHKGVNIAVHLIAEGEFYAAVEIIVLGKPKATQTPSKGDQSLRGEPEAEAEAQVGFQIGPFQFAHQVS